MKDKLNGINDEKKKKKKEEIRHGKAIEYEEREKKRVNKANKEKRKEKSHHKYILLTSCAKPSSFRLQQQLQQQLAFPSQQDAS